MIFYSTYRERPSLMVARDAREVIPQSRLLGDGDQIHPLFGTEHNVKNRTDVAVCHVFLQDIRSGESET